VKVQGAGDNQPISQTNEVRRIRESTGTKETGGAASSSPAAPDSVEVSELASKTLRSVNASEERIATLRQQHLEGTYEVDSLKVSSKIVDSLFEK
jgi:anti-sigma28 factor (negative regulator of flagellin synthesis)